MGPGFRKFVEIHSGPVRVSRIQGPESQFLLTPKPIRAMHIAPKIIWLVHSTDVIIPQFNSFFDNEYPILTFLYIPYFVDTFEFSWTERLKETKFFESFSNPQSGNQRIWDYREPTGYTAALRTSGRT